MALAKHSLIEFALIEYRRDKKFQALVDGVVQQLIQSGLLQPGTSLPEALALELRDGEPCAKAALRAYHSQTDQPQWLKLRAAS